MTIDLNNVRDYSTAIPQGVIADVLVDIVQYMGSHITKSKTSEALYLNLVLTILEGSYSGRKIYHRIGLKGNKEDEDGNIWERLGKLELKKMLRSAHGISKNSKTKEDEEKLRLEKYEDIIGLKCKVLVGVEPASNGYSEKNIIERFITPDDVCYKAESDVIEDNIPF